MNCCDEYGDCRQGRDCPVRMGCPANVAKVKQRYPKHPQPFPSPVWRRHLKALASWVLLAILGWIIWVPLLYLLLRA